MPDIWDRFEDVRREDYGWREEIHVGAPDADYGV